VVSQQYVLQYLKFPATKTPALLLVYVNDTGAWGCGMSEQLPSPETMDTYRLGERSLREWHKWLTTDPSGRDTGHLDTPGSRYGRTSTDCAWWAVAAQVVYSHASGTDEMDELEVSVDWLQGLAVNDHEDIGTLVREWAWVLPSDLKDELGYQE
jgi:hypothetical protein